MAEREWHEAIDMRRSVVGLAAVLVCAALLRFWSLGSGIPFAVGVDEPQIMERVVRMMRTGDFNPHFFHYPALYIYVQLVVACVRFLAGAMAGTFTRLDQATAADFYLWGRVVTAAMGTATVYLVYRIGMRWGARHALLAAGLLAVMPNHVRESHYVLTDVPTAFFCTLTFLLSLRAKEKESLGAIAWAGAAAGLAVGTKYNAAVVLLLPIIAVYSVAPGRISRLAGVLLAAGACIAAFFLVAPYTVLALPEFLNSFADLARSYGTRAAGSAPGWSVYLKHLRLGFGWPSLLLMLGGVGLAIYRRVSGPGQARFAMLLAFPLLYFWMIATRDLIYARYLLPILPFLCLLVGIAVISGVSLLRRFAIPRAVRTTLIAALTVAALLPPAIRAIGFDVMIGKPSTYAVAYGWITSHVPPGAKISVETGSFQIPGGRYQVEQLKQLIDRDYDTYASSGVEYLVASSQAFGNCFASPERYPAEYASYQRLFGQSTLLTSVVPSDTLMGPEVRVYRLRQ